MLFQQGLRSQLSAIQQDSPMAMRLLFATAWVEAAQRKRLVLVGQPVAQGECQMQTLPVAEPIFYRLHAAHQQFWSRAAFKAIHFGAQSSR